jgi:hypothetical protein
VALDGEYRPVPLGSFVATEEQKLPGVAMIDKRRSPPDGLNAESGWWPRSRSWACPGAPCMSVTMSRENANVICFASHLET